MVEVSVLMPVYNSEKYLSESIESILSQDYTNFEFIIIDDGSTDRSIEIINSYNDPRIKFFSNEENKGISYTRNRSIDIASGKFLAILDSDDIALPGRISKQVKFLEDNPDFGMVGSWFEYIDKEGKLTGEVARYLCPSPMIPAALLFNNHFAQSTIMIRKSALPDIKYKAEYPISSDYDLWIRIAERNKVANLSEVLVKYRIHDTNISKHAENVDREDLIIMKDQLSKLGDFSSEEINLCFALSRRKILNSDRSIKAASNVLSKIYSLNKINKKYNDDILGNFLGGFFCELINKLDKYNLKTFQTVERSEIVRYIHEFIGSKFKFFRKCFKGQLRGK